MLRPAAFVPLVLLCAACSISVGGDRAIGSITGADQHAALEVVQTVEEQAKSEIQEAPTQFLINFEDDRHAWERARLFFEKYLRGTAGSKAPVVSKIKGNTWALASNPQSGQYHYEITREPVKGGYLYSIVCTPRAGGNAKEASKNAQNVARFVRDGRLEIAQIVP